MAALKTLPGAHARLSVQSMLQANPKGSDARSLAMWLLIKPLSIEFYERFWHKLESDLPLFDEDAEYQEWEEGHYWY